MPKIQLFGEAVRVRVMLDAIGAQEALEAHAVSYPLHAAVGTARRAALAKERVALAHRRNAAESKLRPEEHRAWTRYRDLGVAPRAAAWAMLTDLPSKEAGVDD